MLRVTLSLLSDGQLDTRMHAKRALSQLKQLMESAGLSFDALAARLGGNSGKDVLEVRLCQLNGSHALLQNAAPSSAADDRIISIDAICA